MHLGSLIRHLQAEQDAAVALAALGDAELFANVEAMSAHYDETPPAYVALAASRFANLAGDDDWLAIVGAAERSDDPGRVMLAHMLRWSLQRDAREQMAVTACENNKEACGCNASKHQAR